jgi:hypothetical protein
MSIFSGIDQGGRVTDIAAEALAVPDIKPHVWRRRDYLRTYFGDNWGDYIGVYDAMEQRPGLALSWSWTIFFIPWIWMVYRKRYDWAIGTFVLLTLIDALTDGWVNLLARVGFAVFLGANGKALYVRHATGAVEKILAHTKSQHGRVGLVRAKGGVSERGIMIIVSVFILIYVAALAVGAINRT